MLKPNDPVLPEDRFETFHHPYNHRPSSWISASQWFVPAQRDRVYPRCPGSDSYSPQPGGDGLNTVREMRHTLVSCDNVLTCMQNMTRWWWSFWVLSHCYYLVLKIALSLWCKQLLRDWARVATADHLVPQSQKNQRRIWRRNAANSAINSAVTFEMCSVNV